MEDEPAFEWNDLREILLTLMRMDAKLDEIKRLLLEEDENGEEEETDA